MEINTKKMSKIKFTVPDGTPEEQIKMIKDLKSVVVSMGKLTGEKVDTKPFDEQIERLSKT